MHEAHKAARAIAALADFAAIGIENPVAKIRIGARGFFDQQYLVAANAEVPVGNVAQLRRAEMHSLTDRVKDDEVIAQAVHFSEA